MNGMLPQGEATAGDNFVEWSPSSLKFGEKWEDGKTYWAKVQIRQDAPGKGELLQAIELPGEGQEEQGETMDEGQEGADEGAGAGAPGEMPEGEPQQSDEEPVMAQASRNPSYANPAIAKMMARKRKA